MPRVYLLSPANCSGRRAQQLLAPRATFDLAHRLQSAAGASLGEVFSFVSGLYFRGKLTYARRFADAAWATEEVSGGGVLVITPGAGLRSADTIVTADAIRRFATIDIDCDNPEYRLPLERGASALATALGPDGQVVLLGSVASSKYVDVLVGIFGERLLFPTAFVGRGDMSRGGLLLRHAAAGEPLEYAPVQGAIRHGVRPPKLPPLPRRLAQLK